MPNPLFNTLNLDGKIALVTGASSGLGAHFGKILAGAGARVVVTARRESRLDALVNQIQQDGGSATALALDVNDPEAVKGAFDEIQLNLGTVQIVVNNAGVASPKPFLDTTEDDWEYIFNTNLRAVWRVSCEAANRMVTAETGGSIINIASILGLHTGKNQTLYATAKAGVVQLTKNTAMELWRHDIRVNAICPGYVETEMNNEFFSSYKGQTYLKTIQPKRLGRPDELNILLLMLAGEAGSFITGAAIPVDGGHLTQSL